MTSQKKKDYIYNTIGSIIYALNSVVLLLIVIQIVGPEQGGGFSIAFTISQTVCVIGNFEMRIFQVTDSGTYSFQDYFLSRIYTSFMMIAVTLIWIVVNGYKHEKAILILILCAYRLSDTFGDVIEGYYQQQDKLYISSILLSLRSSIPTILFTVVLILTQNLMYGSFTLMISAIILLGVFDFGTLVFKDNVKLMGGKNQKVLGVLVVCLPLFIGSFLSTYIVNAPKYAIDKYLNETLQSYYAIIFMPSFAINLFSAFLFKPLLLDIALIWNKRDIHSINKIKVKMFGYITFITLLAVFFGRIAGIPILSYIYGVPAINQYAVQFIIILLGGGLHAYCMFLYHILITMRKQRCILFAYLIVYIEAVILSNIMVIKYGITGASITYLINCTTLVIIFLIEIKQETRCEKVKIKANNSTIKKILYLENFEAPYRVPFYNLLAEKYYLDMALTDTLEEQRGRNQQWRNYDKRKYKIIYLKQSIKLFGYNVCFGIIKLLKDEYDLVFMDMYGTPTHVLAIVWLKLILHKPFILSVDGMVKQNKESVLSKMIKKLILKCPYLILSSGAYVDDCLVKYGVNKERIVRYAFTSVYEADIVSLDYLNIHKEDIRKKVNYIEEKIIISVGRFIQSKGFDILLEAARSFPPEWGVYIIGDVPTQDYLDYCRIHKIRNVHFVGFKTKEELKIYYMAADLFVLPTRSDVWGLVINEAMANGLPVITTEKCVAGIELIQNAEGGYIIPVDDTVQLVEKCKEILLNETLLEKMRKTNLSKIRDYTIEKMAQKHLEVFEDFFSKCVPDRME